MTRQAREMFRTERLLVRQIDDTDVDALHAVYGDADAMRFVDDGQPLDRAGCSEWVGVSQRNYASRGYGMSVLVLRSDRQVIGFCGLVHPDGQVEPELKYALRRAFWGQGFASEAAAGMCSWGQREFGMREIIATIDPDNVASQHVLEKTGMCHEIDRTDPDGSITAVYRWQP